MLGLMPGKVRSPEGTGCLTSGEVSPTASTPSYGLKSGEVPPDRGGGGRGGTKGRSKGGKCHREDELNQNQEVRQRLGCAFNTQLPRQSPVYSREAFLCPVCRLDIHLLRKPALRSQGSSLLPFQPGLSTPLPFPPTRKSTLGQKACH